MNEVDGWQDTAAAADPVSLCLVLSLIRPPPLHLLLLLSLSLSHSSTLLDHAFPGGTASTELKSLSLSPLHVMQKNVLP